MLRALALVLALAIAIPAKAQTVYSDGAMVRQFVATVEGSPRQLAERLAADLPAGAVQGSDGEYMIAFAEPTAPFAFVRFLTSTFEALADETGLSRGLNVSLHLLEVEGGTEVRAILVTRVDPDAVDGVSRFHSRLIGLDIPAGAEILLDGASDGSGGDLVLSLRGAPETVSERYAEALEAQGFDTSRAAMGPATLLQAQRADALVMIFIQADPENRGQTLVVIRSTEDA